MRAGTSFEEFFAGEYERLLRAIYLITHDRYEAEEVVQEAFVRVCERWDRIGSMSNPAGYLYRTALNLRRSSFRRLGLAAGRVLGVNQGDPISDSDERDAIRRALATLPPKQREALVLVEWLGFDHDETGRILGASPGAVRVRLSRARKSLRPLVEGRPA